ncbi:glycosyl transferase [Actinomyces oris]|uniref:ATP-grasp fold amidoligase family protein n=1 Tax=Actinomyces oris TaxID=544580 RepID=UPI000C7844A9|nr:ATP-grasp fold amidoligase family protein [Actinomyces oris]PKY74006.1 glycosyl transferase [Actinomyces oris]
MSIKGAAEAVLPPPAQGWLKQAIYHRNCHLSPPQYRAALKHWYWLFKGRPCHLEAPRTMTEKIHWLKLYDSTPLKGRLADKFLVREWVADTVGEEYLVPLLGVWDSPDEIDFASLPASFVLKATHGSGWNILVPNKSALDEEWARGRLREWLGLRQAIKGGFELHYEYCEPRIVCERFLRDGTGGLRDYKFMVFDGVVQFAFTVDRRAGLAMRGTYLPDWTRAPFEYTCEAVRAPDVPPPSGLETMLRLASRLGKGFACARVDFYQVRGRVYFGEITFTDADGLSEFAPARYNRIFGDRIVLPEKKSFKGIIL